MKKAFTSFLRWPGVKILRDDVVLVVELDVFVGKAAAAVGFWGGDARDGVVDTDEGETSAPAVILVEMGLGWVGLVGVGEGAVLS